MRAAVALLLLVLSAGACLSDSSSAEIKEQTKKQCLALTTCYMGGDRTNPCTIATGDCPSCVVFTGDACYARIIGINGCTFGTDCSPYWESTSSSSSSDSDSESASAASSNSSTPETSSPTSSSKSNGAADSNSASASSGGATPESSSSHSSSSSTEAAIAIIGTSIGVVFLGYCVRRVWWRRARDSSGYVQG